MKRIANCIVIALICAFILTSICYAHAGRTDSNGGHFDNSTGSYHYHHGYPAHQHYPDCPYDYDDQTNRNGSGSSSSSVASSLSHSEEDSTWYKNGYKYGYDKGKVDGYYDGYKDGKADGYKEGQKDGYDEGFDEGYLTGQSEKEKILTEQFQEELHKNKLIFTATLLTVCLLVWYFAANRYRKKYEGTGGKPEEAKTDVILQKPEQNEYSKLRKPKGKQYSSFIEEYWHYNGSLFVRMKSGDTYRYYNVPVYIFEEMEKADSIGSFFNTRINGEYKYDILK